MKTFTQFQKLESSGQFQQGQDTNEQINIEKLNKLIVEGHNFIKEKLNTAIIVIGCTGSGKSTLINALTRKTLIVKPNPEDPNEIIIDLAGNEASGLKIGHSPVISETTVPKYNCERSNQVGYFDCPGFEDTKSCEQDIANNIYIKQIFENVAKVKIVVVAQEEEFNMKAGRGKNISSFFTQLITMMDGVDDEIIKSICLVITKVKPKINCQGKIQQPTLDGIINELQNFKSQHQKSQDSSLFDDYNFTKIFDNFLQKDRVGLFLYPLQEVGTSIAFPDEINKIIQQIPYAKSPKFNCTVSQTTLKKLNNCYNQLYQDAQQQEETLKVQSQQFLISAKLSGALQLMMLLQKILSLEKYFKVKDPKKISDEIKSEYKTNRKELENFIKLGSVRDILEFINFISEIKLLQYRYRIIYTVKLKTQILKFLNRLFQKGIILLKNQMKLLRKQSNLLRQLYKIFNAVLNLRSCDYNQKKYSKIINIQIIIVIFQKSVFLEKQMRIQYFQNNYIMSLSKLILQQKNGALFLMINLKLYQE